MASHEERKDEYCWWAVRSTNIEFDRSKPGPRQLCRICKTNSVNSPEFDEIAFLEKVFRRLEEDTD